MANYNVTLTSKMANASVSGTVVTADTQQAAQKAANLQAAEKSHADFNKAWDWKASVTPAA